ncbi:MAG: phosphate transport system regulatory protein PhoU [Deltaproteobacteria bacterium RIFCSPHIGHO2_02_FULL_40_11]|nr:MAG: phosphate transport system regulatory protein PhoU [Deltaproteobacteria bacterium RIFCSPHIGHO2_02_FULL_40_11]
MSEDKKTRLFEKDLDKITETLTQMGGMVEKAILTSILALKNRDTRLAKEVIRDDAEIDQKEIDIDQRCIQYIALQQPKAGDLRFVTSAMKINNDLERMGDYAESIARQALFLSKKPAWRPLVNIPLMADIATSMVRDCLNAFVRRDTQIAYDVIQRDEEVDKMQSKVYKNLLNDMLQDKNNIERASALILVSSKLERIADQSTNICEEVIYLVTGENVRHRENITLEDSSS